MILLIFFFLALVALCILGQMKYDIEDPSWPNGRPYRTTLDGQVEVNQKMLLEKIQKLKEEDQNRRKS